MEFLLPGDLEDGISLTAPPPAHRGLIIPFAIPRHYSFPGGSCLSQQIEGSDFSIWQRHFFIHQPSLLYFHSNRPLLALNYMMEGAVACRLQGVGEITMEENSSHMLYIAPRDKNEALFTPGNFRCIHIGYSSAFLQKMPGKDLLLKPAIAGEGRCIIGSFRHAPSPITRKIKTLLEEIIACRETEANRQLLFDARVRELLFLHAREQDNNRYANTKPPGIIEELTGYITEHLDQDLSLSALCRQAKKSKTALQKIFKDHRQKSIHRLIMEIRMAKAMELLVTTDLPIGEIAALTNNNSFSYFSSSFTRYFGHPPSHYRKKENCVQNLK